MKPSEEWKAYIEYLKDWADDHKDGVFEGMSPVCFDEFLEMDYVYEEEL